MGRNEYRLSMPAEDIVLLTYDQLAAARRVYQAAGFRLDAEHPEEAFGQRMNCQTWSREL